MINLYNLKYFVDAARLGSMSKAAELNFLTRPAISLAIKKLEEDLGTDLVIHKQRSFELTDAGLVLLRKSDDLLGHVENLENEIKGVKGTVTGDFRIGSARTLATFNLPKAMVKLKSLYPEVDFKIQLANGGALIEKLQNKEIDMAFFISDDSSSEFKSVVVSKGYYALVKPKGAGEKDLQYALTERRQETERLKVLYERQFSRSLPVFAEVHSWDAIWTWVNSGICGGLVPDFLFGSKNGPKNYSVVIPKVFPYEIKAMFPKNKVGHPVIKSFLANLDT